MFYIFLDCDGVINTKSSWKNPYTIQKEKVKLNFSGNIKANKNDIPLNITYIENKIYINSNDINVYIKTDNLLKELNGILKSVGFDFLDLENLSMDTVLGLLGNCETIPQEEGNLLYLNAN